MGVNDRVSVYFLIAKRQFLSQQRQHGFTAQASQASALKMKLNRKWKLPNHGSLCTTDPRLKVIVLHSFRVQPLSHTLKDTTVSEIKSKVNTNTRTKTHTNKTNMHVEKSNKKLNQLHSQRAVTGIKNRMITPEAKKKNAMLSSFSI